MSDKQRRAGRQDSGEGWIFGRVLELGTKIRPGSTQAGTGSYIMYMLFIIIYMSIMHFHLLKWKNRRSM